MMNAHIHASNRFNVHNVYFVAINSAVFRGTFALQFLLTFIRFTIILPYIVAQMTPSTSISVGAVAAAASQTFIIITKYGRN